MSLQNLLGISLDAVEPDKAQIRRLLASAERNVADARIDALAAENQFDVAYKAILQLAMLALNANGYRTLTSRPGHHQTVIQALALTRGLQPDKVRLLDALRSNATSRITRESRFPALPSSSAFAARTNCS